MAVLALWLLAVPGLAQDSAYVKNFTHKFLLTSRLGLRGQAFQFRPDGLATTLDYAPNVAATLSLGFNYKWLGLGVGIKLPESPINEGRGETDQFDIQLNSYGREYGFDVFYLDYRGFYLSNTRRALGPQPSGEPFYLRPDIENQVYGLNLYYVFNHERFSYRSVFTFNEQQLRTAGSWLAQVNLANFKSRADSAFVPSQLTGDLTDPQLGEISYLRFLQAGALGGYGLNVVVKRRFYGSASLLFGLALIDYHADGPGGEVGSGQRISARALLRGGAGYSSDRWFWGANTLIDAYNLRYSESLDASFFVTQFRFYLGHRFDWKLW